MRGINAPIYYEMPINDKLFIAQADVIKEVAKRVLALSSDVVQIMFLKMKMWTF